MLDPLRYYGFTYAENGEVQKLDSSRANYATHVFNAEAVRAIRQLGPDSRPLFMVVDQLAPHQWPGPGQGRWVPGACSRSPLWSTEGCSPTNRCLGLPRSTRPTPPTSRPSSAGEINSAQSRSIRSVPATAAAWLRCEPSIGASARSGKRSAALANAATRRSSSPPTTLSSMANTESTTTRKSPIARVGGSACNPLAGQDVCPGWERRAAGEPARRQRRSCRLDPRSCRRAAVYAGRALPHPRRQIPGRPGTGSRAKLSPTPGDPARAGCRTPESAQQHQLHLPRALGWRGNHAHARVRVRRGWDLPTDGRVGVLRPSHRPIPARNGFPAPLGTPLATRQARLLARLRRLAGCSRHRRAGIAVRQAETTASRPCRLAPENGAQPPPGRRAATGFPPKPVTSSSS